MSENSEFPYEPPYTILVDGQQVGDQKHLNFRTAEAAARELAEGNPGYEVQIYDGRWEEVIARRELR